MASTLQNEWASLLQDEFEKPYFKELRQFLQNEYKEHTVYPPKGDILNALRLTNYSDIKVVILGQDPYHGPNQAEGLSFSVKPGMKLPPSLKNIYKELYADMGCDISTNGSLIKWTQQGVLLLNTVLTVRQSEPNSHKGKGWETFTNRIIELINEREKPVVFILWGKHAQAKKAWITNDRHFIIEAPHPSPFSANQGFLGSKPFSTCNAFLRKQGQEEIDWTIPSM